jgi:hypothetical protein
MSERVGLSVKRSEGKGKDPGAGRVRPGVSPGMDMGSPVEQVLYLQRTIGNRAVTRLIEAGVLQARLRVGAPNDIYEQEAERIADRVMGMTAAENPGIRRQTEEEEEEITPLVQRQVEPEEEEEEPVQARSSDTGTPEVTPDLESRIHALKSGGQPLPASTRAFFEPRFGTDFSHVRLHTDTNAAQTAQALNARAFTTGHHIAFAPNQYSPHTTPGQHLLAHELTHVLQQGNNAELGIQRELIETKKPITRVPPTFEGIKTYWPQPRWARTVNKILKLIGDDVQKRKVERAVQNMLPKIFKSIEDDPGKGVLLKFIWEELKKEKYRPEQQGQLPGKRFLHLKYSLGETEEKAREADRANPIVTQGTTSEYYRMVVTFEWFPPLPFTRKKRKGKVDYNADLVKKIFGWTTELWVGRVFLSSNGEVLEVGKRSIIELSIGDGYNIRFTEGKFDLLALEMILRLKSSYREEKSVWLMKIRKLLKQRGLPPLSRGVRG